MKKICGSILKPERNRQYVTHRHCHAIHLARFPFRHILDYSDGFLVERRISPSQNRHVAHLSVHVDDKAAQHATLYPFLVCIIRIFALAVDIINQATLVARESRLNVNEVIFVDIHTLSMRTMLAIESHPRHLRGSRRSNKHRQCYYGETTEYSHFCFLLNVANICASGERNKHHTNDLCLFENVLCFFTKRRFHVSCFFSKILHTILPCFALL